jgi:hypothetical protein
MCKQHAKNTGLDYMMMVTREEVVASYIFARAKAKAKIRGSMYVTTEKHVVTVKFEMYIGGEIFTCQFSISKLELLSNKDNYHYIFVCMMEAKMNFLKSSSNYHIQEWLVYENKI